MPSASVLKSGTFLPLFSLNTIVDTDLGILNYVFKEFRNDRYFDLNVLDYMELINKVYYRSFKNPLYVIMKNPDSEEDKKFLDECYDEFIVDKEFEILSNSLSTQMMEIIKMFINEGNIIPTIMYYSQAQLDYIQSIIDFDNYSSKELYLIFEKMAIDNGYRLAKTIKPFLIETTMNC